MIFFLLTKNIIKSRLHCTPPPYDKATASKTKSAQNTPLQGRRRGSTSSGNGHSEVGFEAGFPYTVNGGF
jgi:hypothetical protein